MEDAALMDPRLPTDLSPADQAEVETASQPFVGQWNVLVSTTNWEKGRIIWEWRNSLIQTGAPASWYSDEAWSQLVGGVTSQHVGRLRRVFQRFGDSYSQYEGLYWSHFQAALDWEDAEMWLEGAARSEWTVAAMREQRWETLDAVQRRNAQNELAPVVETDEDYVPPVADDSVALHAEKSGDAKKGERSTKAKSDAPDDDASASIYSGDSPKETIDFVRPFENLSELPEDLAEAFEQYKLAILRHKGEDWQQISCEEVLASLDALKELAKAPSNDDAF